MHWKEIGLVLTLTLLLIPGGVWAEEADDAEETGPGPANRLEEMVVTGTRTPHTLKDAPVETIVINHEDIEQSNAQTVSDLVKTIPGMSAQGVDNIFGSASSRVRLRGLSFNNGYGLILIDGQRLHGSSQSGAHGEYAVGLNQIPISMIERIEVIKGPSSVLYGSDAMAGVINIITRKIPNKATSGGGAKYGWYKVKEGLNYYTDEVVTPTDDGKSRNTRTAYAYTGNKINDRAGFLLSYSHEDSEGTGATPYDYNRDSAMGKVDVLLTDATSGWVKGEISNYKRTSTSITEEDVYRIAAGMDFNISQNHKLMLKGHHYVDDFSTSTRGGHIGYDQGELQYTWYTNAGHVLTAGTDVQRQTIDYIMNNSGSGVTTTTTVLEDVDTFSAYLQDEWTLFNKLTLVPGVRYDNHSTFGDSFNPKLNVMYKVLDNTSLRASVGKSFKSPTIRQLYYDIPFWHSPFWIASNPDLEPEKSIGYSFGIEQWLFDNRGMINVTCYRNDITDMVVTDSTGQTYEGSPLYIYENVDEAMVQGVEVSAQFYPTDSFSIMAGYAYTDSEDKASGHKLTYTPEHQVSLSPAYEYEPWGLGASGTLVYASDQYTNADNTRIQDAHVIVDGKVFKRLTKVSKITLEVSNIFDSDFGDERNVRAGRIITLGIDMDF